VLRGILRPLRRPRPSPRGPWKRLGVRARVTFLFGAGALVLSTSLGGLAYFTAQHFLVSERESASQHQAYVSATLVRSQLYLGNLHYDQLLASLDSGSGSSSVLYVGDHPYASPLSATGSVPSGLLQLVRSGTPATQTLPIDGSPQIVVGVPIPSVHATYFQVFDVGDLAHTLRVLFLALVAGGLVTTVLGVALGQFASRRSLRPLTGVSSAAVAIAGGDLDTRLPEATGDPDLEGLTASFNRMVDQLQERIERDARFTSDVSHELRSPLTTLAASLEVLENNQDELSTRSRRALQLLGADLRRFERMVGDLLEISRSGAADLSQDEVETGELVYRAVIASSRNLPPHLDPPVVIIDAQVSGTRIVVDKRRFERIMVNLLENAALYGGGATRVTADPGPRNADGLPTVQVGVEDRGPGIPETERLVIFERFYRGQAAGRRGTGTGTGLGLALVADHVRLHGGNVWAESANGGGARFVIELPILEEDETW
jgi:two-component system sensor histidine kinase MtrB